MTDDALPPAREGARRETLSRPSGAHTAQTGPRLKAGGGAGEPCTPQLTMRRPAVAGTALDAK